MKIRLTQNVLRYARLTEGMIVDAEPVASHPEVMRELVLPDEELEALLNEG